ncbi:MAG: mycofactocin biosynthesis chaperone MftB [Acidimicrobiia bacterium]|nr:mycofactocin biosynthesis chaperone MftB [Acidimicrobiia bacterium]
MSTDTRTDRIAVFDADRALRMSPRIGLRPEPFGALAYHFDTRRLVFLKSPSLVALVESLADHDTAADAIDAAGGTHSPGSYRRALASLEEAEVICAR